MGVMIGGESQAFPHLQLALDHGLIVVTDRRQAEGPLLDVVKAVLDCGARVILLREKDLPREERLELAQAMRDLGADVIAAGPDPLGGNAVHLSAADPMVQAELVGRSCHSVAEVAGLSDEDYCTLSPIFESLSKPGYGPPLGPIFPAGKRVFALGGIDSPARARACLEAGADGVAVMGAIMRNPSMTREFVKL